MSTLVFTPWPKFGAVADKFAVASFLHDVGAESLKAFKKGLSGKHSGITYVRSGGRNHRASAPGEFPANDSGALNASLNTEVRMYGLGGSATIGSNTRYSGFLADGTSRMAKRRMSKEALELGMKTAHFTKPFVRFKRGL